MTALKQEQKIKIKLKAYENRSLDAAARDIVDAALRSGARISGPVPLPTEINKMSVNRSPHIDKESMDQFEIRTHARVIYIVDPNAKTVEDLRKLNLPAGVEITINL